MINYETKDDKNKLWMSKYDYETKDDKEKL